MKVGQKESQQQEAFRDLGFRDLEAFNEALLAKQLSRILTSPNLLMSKVIRAKYLKDPNALENNPPNQHHGHGKAFTV